MIHCTCAKSFLSITNFCTNIPYNSSHFVTLPKPNPYFSLDTEGYNFKINICHGIVDITCFDNKNNYFALALPKFEGSISCINLSNTEEEELGLSELDKSGIEFVPSKNEGNKIGTLGYTKGSIYVDPTLTIPLKRQLFIHFYCVTNQTERFDFISESIHLEDSTYIFEFNWYGNIVCPQPISFNRTLFVSIASGIILFVIPLVWLCCLFCCAFSFFICIRFFPKQKNQQFEILQ